MHRLHIIAVRWANPFMGLSRTESVDMAVAALGEWVRYNAETWLVVTQHDGAQITERVRPALSPNDTVIVLPIDGTAAVGGYAPQAVWDLVSKRASPLVNALMQRIPSESSLGSMMTPVAKNRLSGEH